MESSTIKCAMTARFLGIASILLAANDIVHSECPDGWTVFQGSCYEFGHTSLTFQEAEQFCVHHGSHLVHIDNAAENAFIKSYLGDLKDPKHWIGLRDEVIEGRWTWYDTDLPAIFTSWDTGEPNGDKTVNCAAIFDNHRYNWVDEPCTYQYKALCEKRNEKPACTETVVG